MRTRQTSLRKNCNRFGRQEEMGTQTPDAAGSTAPVFGTEHSYPAFSPNSTSIDGVSVGDSAWHGSLVVALDESSPSQRHALQEESHTNVLEESLSQCSTQCAPSPPPYRDHYEELAQMLVSMVEGADGEELAEAFLEASTLPPITKQSLSELDIHNIVNNIKLRHDVNFDRDLSFRPNLDGARGQAKSKVTERYWKALVAELELYTRLFYGTPMLKDADEIQHAQLKLHAKNRIPVMFETIQEVLKSLVPERDQSRVKEHLDVPMLMQEIERGVCDFGRLAEWMALLLKEHCAPMRDSWVDEMVSSVRAGAVAGNAEMIVDGLRRLFGVLETMKLDVANHQIRNLKPNLIEDTVNFEKQYQLEKLVARRSRVDINSARAWYHQATLEFNRYNDPGRRMTAATQLEIFNRAVLTQFFTRDGRCELPETFYLDEDRLRTLKAEIEDLVRLEVCTDVFSFFLRQLKYESDVSPTMRQQVRSAVVDLMGDAMGYGASQWIANSWALSTELFRQASIVAGQDWKPTHETSSAANEHLSHALQNASSTHNTRLKITLLHRVSACVQRHANSSPVDLFTHLVPAANAHTGPPTNLLHLYSNNASTPSALNPETAKWQDIADRISHIILLHWRVWKDIAYVPEGLHNAGTSHTSPLHPRSSNQQQSQGEEQDASVLPSMHTGELPDAGPDAHAAHGMKSR